MPTLVFGILVLVLALWALNAYSKADPEMLAKLLPSAGGIGALLALGHLLASERLARPQTIDNSGKF